MFFRPSDGEPPLALQRQGLWFVTGGCQMDKTLCITAFMNCVHNFQHMQGQAAACAQVFASGLETVRHVADPITAAVFAVAA